METAGANEPEQQLTPKGGGIKYFSTFTGIGGFELGIHAAVPAAECVGYSEIDKYASSVYEGHFPGVQNYGDIRKINPGDLPRFDLFVGGFPCQAFSVAGKRLGFDDTRGTLFFEVARLLKAKRPRHLVLENVKGLLSHDGGKTFTTILGVLSDLGYFVEWQVLNSKDHGVPQNRERVYIIGHLGGAPRQQVFPVAGEERATIAGGADVVSHGRFRATDGVALTLTANYYKGHDNHGQRPMIHQVNSPTHSSRRVFGDDGVSPTLKARARQDETGPPLLLVREATAKGYAEATVGDSVNVSVPGSKTRRGRVQKGLAGTLQTSENQVTLMPDARIRRLTPMECERLQGFPDDWTRYDRDGKEVSDTQRYKMCGNAVTTNVVRAVMERLYA